MVNSPEDRVVHPSHATGHSGVCKIPAYAPMGYGGQARGELPVLRRRGRKPGDRSGHPDCPNAGSDDRDSATTPVDRSRVVRRAGPRSLVTDLLWHAEADRPPLVANIVARGILFADLLER